MTKKRARRARPAVRETTPVFSVGDLVVAALREEGPGSETVPGADVGIIVDVRESSGPMSGYIPYGYLVQWPCGKIASYSSTALLGVKSDSYTQ
jgi:hypothetical protein